MFWYMYISLESSNVKRYSTWNGIRKRTTKSVLNSSVSRNKPNNYEMYVKKKKIKRSLSDLIGSSPLYSFIMMNLYGLKKYSYSNFLKADSDGACVFSFVWTEIRPCWYAGHRSKAILFHTILQLIPLISDKNVSRVKGTVVWDFLS